MAGTQAAPDLAEPSAVEVVTPKPEPAALPEPEASTESPGPAATAAPTETSPARRSPAKKTPAKKSPAKKAPATQSPRRSRTKPAPAWVEPVGNTCPPSHPVKAKLASRLFHLPGMFAYERTRPDRCYRDEEAALADGLRKAKR